MPSTADLLFDVEIKSRDGQHYTERVQFPPLSDGLSLLDMIPAIYMSAGMAITERTGLGPDRLALDFVRKFGEKSEYLVEAHYPRDGGPFAERFSAVDEEDAHLQAVQAMAENDAHAYGDRGFAYDPTQSISYMKQCIVQSIEQGPSPDQIKAALLSFWLAHESGEADRIAEVKATTEALMIRAGMLNEPEQADEEDFDDEVDDDETPQPGMR